MMETPMIEVKHLKKYFDTPKGLLHAVDDISFKIGKAFRTNYIFNIFT